MQIFKNDNIIYLSKKDRNLIINDYWENMNISYI